MRLQEVFRFGEAEVEPEPEPEPVGSDRTSDDSEVIVDLDFSEAFDDLDPDAPNFGGGDSLPPGLELDPDTGLVSGTIDSNASVGTDDSDDTHDYDVTVTATNGD